MQQHGKYYITLKGVHYEVSQEVHDAYYQVERQERYMAEKDQSRNARLGKRVCRDLVVVKDTCSRSPADLGEALELTPAFPAAKLWSYDGLAKGRLYHAHRQGRKEM